MSNVEVLLIGLIVSTMSLMLFVFLGNEILNFLKAAPPLQKAYAKIPRPNLALARRRAKTKPGIICSLPIHQKGSSEISPFF